MADVKTDSVTLVATFIETGEKGNHEALRVESHFNKQKEEYERKEKHHDLQDILGLFQEQSGAELGFDATNCSWDVVIEQMQKALNDSTNSGPKIKRLFRGVWRGAGNISAVISPIFQMCADELSVLHGGLAVMFSIARHRAENRQKILHAFGNLPNVIQMAHQKLETFGSNESLRKSVQKLHDTLFDAIPKLIAMLVPKTIATRAKSPFVGHSIGDLLDSVHQRTEEVRVCAESIRDTVMVQTRLEMHSVHEIASHVEMNVGVIRRQLSGFAFGMNGHTQELDSCRKEIQQLRHALESQTALFAFLKDEVLKYRCAREDQQAGVKPTSTTQKTTPRHEGPSNTEKTRPASFGGPNEDLQWILKRGKQFDAASTGKVMTIVQTSHFGAWLCGPSSSLLLVDANMDPRKMGKISPMSYFCAMLSEVFHDIGDGVCLNFFCGQHLVGDVNACGPKALIRSLLGQLICQAPQSSPAGGAEPPGPEWVRQAAQSSNCRDLCDSFRQLLSMLPPGFRVYCLVDGLSWFEGARWKDDYAMVVWDLLRMAEDARLPARLKLLLTSPTRSPTLGGRLRPDQYLELKRVPANNRVSSERSFVQSVRVAVKRAGFGNGR